MSILPNATTRFLTLAIFLVFLGPPPASSDPSVFRITTGRSFYTKELQARILLQIPIEFAVATGLSVDVLSEEGMVATDLVPKAGRLPTVSVDLSGVSREETVIRCRLRIEGNIVDSCMTPVRRCAARQNEVKINRLTGGLIVDCLPVFPVGFYCYARVQQTLPEEEVVRGFNVISPYS